MLYAFRRVSLVAFALLVALITICTITPTAAQAQTPPHQLIINEFRLRGPGGANDEFIEIVNNDTRTIFVSATSGTGYGIAASDGVTRCTIPNGTRLDERQSFLCVNSVGYSLSAYPAGVSTTATGDATYTTDIPDNAGIAIFNNNSGGANYSLANRFDAVGSTAETNTLYKEGTGYPALTPFSIDYSFVRDHCGKQGSITTFGPCPSGGFPVDTNDNATNFFYVATNGMSAGAGQRLGAPGPQNRNSPRQLRVEQIPAVLIDANVSASSPPNRVRDHTSNPANNSTFGTLEIRRRFNAFQVGLPVPLLRFRIIDLTTAPGAPGVADLRAISSPTLELSGITDTTTCLLTGTPSTPPCSITIRGTTLDQPPSQSGGGAFNSSFTVPGNVSFQAANVRFVLGVQQPGSFKFYVNAEAVVTIIQP